MCKGKFGKLELDVLYIYIGYWIYSRQKSFLLKIYPFLFSNCVVSVAQSWKKEPTIPNIVETILGAIKGNLYRSLEIFSNHVNNSGGAHSPAEHSPTTAPLSDASLSPIAVIVSTDDRGIWKRGSLATRRRKFRSLFARVSQKNGDESAPADWFDRRQKYWGGVSRAIGPPIPTLHGSAAKERPVLSRFFPLPLPFRPSYFLFLFFVRWQLASRRLNLILNRSAAFTRYRDVTRERGREKSGTKEWKFWRWLDCHVD